MRVIVIGAGEVGTTIAEALHRDNDVVVIERDRRRCEALQHLDVLTLQGNGASLQILREAGARTADLVIACTDVDEVNIVACAAAKQLGSARTVARVQNPDYLSSWKQGHLGVDFMVCNELHTADNIAMILGVPEARHINTFAEGRILMTELRVREGFPIVGLSVAESGVPPGCTVASLIRQGQVIIPRGGDVILEGDLLVSIGTPEAVYRFNTRLTGVQGVNDVVIVGGGRIGYRLAQLLEAKRLNVRLIELDPERCQFLAENLKRTLVLQSDGTDLEFLKRERIGLAEVAVSVMSVDEKNLLSSLLLKRLGVRRVIARVDHPANIEAFEMVGVDVAINPRQLTAEEIIRFTRQTGTEAVTMLEEDRAEVLEIEVSPHSSAVKVPLREAHFPEGTIVGAIVRDGTVIIPRGEDRLLPGDRAIVLTTRDRLEAVERLF